MDIGGGFEGCGIVKRVARLIVSVITGTVILLFALAGCFTGAIAGAFAGKASDSGVLRGAGLGAVAGAVLSVEIFEASRAYLFLDRSGSRTSSSMVSFTNISYDDIHDVYGGVVSRGLSVDVLNKLPSHQILEESDAAQSICCTICLQDLEVGEIARCLPRCNHSFHLACVDKWLVRHGSCPLCRQYV
ncbi:NEP1-interacting protein-like 2 isoform X2 [Ziziphus jujuba]|uniref:NEP1-interacting protein-like 2 isoform X2 n=1 Tax=Ziziphus jujuba TaxID=326968 RepID=A0A6P3ZTR2_ZIZJJ|nr:NEP1-interacting protein-like 2 isoform X2 [Ziziphus jujuba]